MDGTVLVADDDRTIRTVLTQALTRAGCRVHATGSMQTLMKWVEEGRGDVVISDVVMPDGNGLEALPRILKLRPDLPVIVISAQNTIMTAIQAAEADAFDYLPKPFDLPELMKRTAKALERKRVRPVDPTPTPVRTERDVDDLPLVGHSAAMQELYRLVARVLNVDLPVLITGESGVGKSLIAQALHDFSDRGSAPFVIASPDDLDRPDAVQSLLARARDGVILFDGIQDLNDAAQGRLARVLDAVSANNTRILSISQGDLGQAAANGSFRSDLYYRLAGIVIPVPPLRDRIEDIVGLAEHFLTRVAQDGMNKRHLPDDAASMLRAYPWPGNVRELENLISRLAVTGADDTITAAEVETALGAPGASPASFAPSNTSHVQDIGDARLTDTIAQHLQRYFDLHGGALPPTGLYQRILREMELPLIEIALDATGGNQARCADLLGINRNTLRKKITELEIEVTRRRKLM
ncbi:two-component system, NtrC family, nitrogen regulation response regulator GlnG [Aliiroseovarius halocynthiae]|uniref:DNA-binding transcriptional regulator NtrC n=1 Tax=Aliiroseovarius halocynthiae TaxID=985055 RepID=A0A545SWA7_9RHOB|nr:sigma-54 dependent transcriptional regulator [Aliiroseovarius halocynthiae]TQV69262.1 sigma-54-dependent Fis family transcriptional regulator [Aliiroseovarius halocynthiae]SMR72033.1 two-component system, NtrC family, nitrogen regulation response regulator GlnG [Aliiroseovarius halocynthiae]